MKAITLIISLLISFLSHAGLYQCDTPDGEPKLITNNTKKVDYARTIPYTASYIKEALVDIGTKKPFLIYYVVDTEEPFMQYTVNFELAELRRACESSENVNFVTFRNSEFYWGKFSYCKNKKFYEDRLENFPELNEKLKAKRQAIWNGDQSDVISSPLKFVSRYSDDVKAVFYEYPLAHPDFLHDLTEFAITNEKLFPSTEFIPFMNLKSHGNVKTLLSGLQSCQVKSKTASQNAIINKVFNEGERMLLKNPSAYYYYPKSMHPLMEKVALGLSIAAKPEENLGEYSLGEYSLGEYSLGEYSLGDIYSGLGSSEGLGAKFSFGTTQSGLSTVLNRLFNERNMKFVGFVVLESCDTNRKVAVHQEQLPFVLGMYSATNSLWYRNLNWSSLLFEAQGDTGKLIESLRMATNNIQNIVVK
jgi:hypothetical protein